MCPLGIAVSKGDCAGVAGVWVRLEDVAARFCCHDEEPDGSIAMGAKYSTQRMQCLRMEQTSMSKESNAWTRVVLGITHTVTGLCGTSQVGFTHNQKERCKSIFASFSSAKDDPADSSEQGESAASGTSSLTVASQTRDFYAQHCSSLEVYNLGIQE